MLKAQLLTELTDALWQLKAKLAPLAELDDATYTAALAQHLRLERPKLAEHGDYAINVSFLARWAKQAPPALALALAQLLQENGHSQAYEVQAIAGFINLKLQPLLLANVLLKALRQEKPGSNTSLAGQRILLEYVSANPTGPLHVGHGRWAALGDTLHRILQASGAQSSTEFYVNDYGQQMDNMANSLWFRCLEALSLGAFPEPVEGEKFAYYPGEYVVALAEAYLAEPQRQEQTEALFKALGAVRLSKEQGVDFKLFAREAMLKEQKDLLERLRVPFDVWLLESSLHQEGLVEKALTTLRQREVTFEEEGALWLKSSALGDEKDRVLVKSDGSYTYLAADVAYHHHKYCRTLADGSAAFNRVINIWGADHHGYVARLRASVAALGHAPESFEVVLGQLVNLVVDGQQTRMGKRTKMLTLADVADEVGVDATRFWLIARSADSTLDFDVNLAASASDENPVFYTQYAHARACSILKQAFLPPLSQKEDADSTEAPKAELKAPLEEAEWQAYLTHLTPEQLQADLLTPLMDQPKAIEAIRELMMMLDSFTDKVEDAARLLSPHLLARYALDLAAQFHSFYAHCRVITPVKSYTLSRLVLVQTFQRTLAATLDLLGVSAPQHM